MKVSLINLLFLYSVSSFASPKTSNYLLVTVDKSIATLKSNDIDLYGLLSYPTSIKTATTNSNPYTIPNSENTYSLLLSYHLPQDPKKVIKNLQDVLGEQSVSVADESLNIVISAMPNDPLYSAGIVVGSGTAIQSDYQSWFFDMMNFPKAWDYGSGHANIVVFDTIVETNHPDLDKNIRGHFANGTSDNNNLVHGTHVVGLIAATTNNQFGISGACPNCNLFLHRNTGTKDLALSNRNGAQVINWSGGEYANDNFQSSCTIIKNKLANNIPLESIESTINNNGSCSVLESLKKNDVAIVGASGNYTRNMPQFPAREDYVIAVGGVDSSGNIWRNTDPKFPEGQPESGSNTGEAQDYVAPATNILSTVPENDNTYTEIACGDNYNTVQGDGYGPCTGTSMAAPLVSGGIGLLRSLNPLLKVDEIKTLLNTTASNGGVHNSTYGYGIPKIGTAAEKLLGKSKNVQLKNRLSPVFVSYSDGSHTPEGSATTEGYFFTTRPQEARASIEGTMYEPKDSNNTVPYLPSIAGSSIAGYANFPSASAQERALEPKAAFSIFANNNNPFGTEKLVPLHRLSFSEKCAVRDFNYTTTQAGIDAITEIDYCPDDGKQTFRLDGIMGYIFSNAQCPPGMVCDDASNPESLQCLHRRYNRTKDNWALIMTSELSNPEYAGYTEKFGQISCIGYVFPNIDTDNDRVINGQELVLGTDINVKDSDCDGLYDGTEYPLADLPASDPMDGTCPGPEVSHPVPTVTTSWSDEEVAQDEMATFYWSSTNANFCTDADGNTIEPSGSITAVIDAPLGSHPTPNITCTGPSGTTSSTATTIQVIESLPPEIEVRWHPNRVTVGEIATLKWITTKAERCIRTDTGAEVPIQGSYQFIPTEPSIFSPAGPSGIYRDIKCWNKRGKEGIGGSEKLVVDARPAIPKVTSAYWHPPIVKSGDEATFHWTSENSTSCKNANEVELEPNGSKKVVINSSASVKTATIRCFGPGGTSESVEATLNIIHPPKVTSAYWSPSTVRQGQRATFHWSSSHATSCEGANGTPRAPSGSQTITIGGPVGTKVSKLRCKGLHGVSEYTSATLKVLHPVPTVRGYWSPSTVKKGQQTTYHWYSTNSSWCRGGNGRIRPTSGRQIITPGTTGNKVARLTCYGPDGASASSVATLRVTP